MKESNFYSDEFELLIREKTEQYKMYPSENVWKGVHNSLHTKRKWFIGSMAFLVTGILFLSGRELIAPSAHSAASKKLAANPSSPDGSGSDAKLIQPEDTQRASFVRFRPAGGTGSAHHNNPTGFNISISHPVVSQPDLSDLLSHAVRLPGQAPSLIASSEVTGTGEGTETAGAEPAGLLDSWLVRNVPENPATHKGTDAATAKNTTDLPRETEQPDNSRETAGHDDGSDDVVRNVLESLSERGQRSRTGGLAQTKSPRHTAMAGKAPDSAGAATKTSTAVVGEASDLQRVNWLHDYAMYTLPPDPIRGRLFLQLYLSPTANYRSLSGGNFNSAKADGSGSNVHPGDPQNWVNRSPAIGFEFGGAVLYRLTRNLTIKGGLQFNFVRYQAVAYAPKNQQFPQGTMVNSPLGYAQYMDSANMNGRGNFDDKTQVTLNTDYYQLSAPIGFELRVLGNERLQFNIGATIQPSYLLNTNSFMLTSDYTNYVKQPSDFRRWNLSGGVEAFLSYQTGPVRWQVGPEFRYQLLSTFNSSYPINESLKGYGLKIGITKSLP